MSERTLYDKVWDRHRVATLPNGQDQLFVSLHLIHEVTSPQAFSMLSERGLDVAYPDRTVAVADHIAPTTVEGRERPLADETAETMLATIEENVAAAGITYYGLDSSEQGITHVVAPELGLTQPGMVVACGDSHTATHGALGAIGIGIGTSQIRDVFASGCIAAEKRAVRRVDLEGDVDEWVSAKDLMLRLLADLGVDGGVGFVYEYGGSAVERLDVEERLALCNMSIEGGARSGYVEPDETTVEYLRGREHVPHGEAFEALAEDWLSFASDDDAVYDDHVTVDVDGLAPMVTWGTNPGQAVEITEPVPDPATLPPGDREAAADAIDHVGVTPGESMQGTPVDVAFIGTCTNGRVSDFERAARVLEGRTVHPDVRALAVPGSQRVKRELEASGVADVFVDAGWEWRESGCSLCIGMNGDVIYDDELCVSASNRNYVGRQGSKQGRTVLASPATVAAAAVEGELVDVREVVG
ncbi:3-isopropylmalate dehydratase large subunit [Halomarina rubra]|uniref:3-isopropylmalate dehydratase n=1 Tax=Halomarina rubra TaxID=2071873 RepID=A0ABD6AXK1_9EURY|nr:3-isopropylmalate dehydratase large subunit [Halomarina rubra]